MLASLRSATVLEESIRSWKQNPTSLEMGFYQEQLHQYNDPDKDEAATAVIALERFSRRQKLIESLKEQTPKK